MGRCKSRVWAVVAALAWVSVTTPAAAEPATTVIFNGSPVPVYFNDGDTFRVLEGPLAGTKARLAGFNTLESYGPAHAWGGWSAKELYAIAKLSTTNARRGTWHCTSDLKRDGYGRVLALCPDLIVDQLRLGYAHALSVGEEPSPAPFIAAQREAIVHRRGMWAKGVPALIMTSTHSDDERSGGGDNYNRLVSSADGHSEKMRHHDRYSECQQVCAPESELTHAAAVRALSALRADPAAGPAVAGVEDSYLILLMNTYLVTGKAPRVFDEAKNSLLQTTFAAMKADGRLSGAVAGRGSCMVYVPFETRYRQPKPSCLKW